MPTAVRIFAPPEDRVRELFAGPSKQQHAADCKVQEHEKKKAYAAELQAQMQEQQMQRQQERVQRFGPRSGAQPAAPWGAAGTQAAPASLQPALGDFSGTAAAAAAAGSAPLAASGSYEQDPQLTIALPAHLQHQHQPPQHQEASWGSPRGPHGLMQEYAHGAGSLSSSSSPPPWMQHSLQQQLQPPNYGVASMLQQQHQKPYANWPMPQQQPVAAPAWPGAPSTSAAMYQGPSPYTTTAVAPSFSSLASSYSPGGISPGRGFQAGASAAAAVAAMQAAAAARSVGPPLAEGHWGLAPQIAMSSEAPFTQQWPPYANSSKSPGALATLGGFSPTSSGGGPAMRGAAESSNSSLPQGRGEQDRARKDAYRAELEAQIRERAAHKAAEKSQHAAEEARKDAEMAAYCPWGRGGAGAPLRDASGQVVTGLRGAARQQQQQQQQLEQWQHQHDQQQQQQQQQVLSTATGFDAAGAAGSWQQQHSGPEGGTLLADPTRSSLAAQGFTQQQQQQQGSGGGAGGGVPGGGGAGPAPVLCFRSDKAFMTAGEIEAKQRQQKELQQELDRQVQEKRRQKELKRQQEEEDARLEEQRIAAEQARLTAQFQDEQDSGRTRANRRSSRGGGAEGEQQGSISAAGGRSTGGGSELLTSKSEGRRRTSVLMAGDDPSPLKQQQSRQQVFGQELASQPSRGSLVLGPHSTAAEEQFHQQQQQYRQQLPPNMQQPSLLLDPQQRQQMLYEALELEGRAGDQHANQELGRLRQDMESQAAALRSAVESQGREVAALRATAAAAEAESAAAKAELAQVKREMLRKSQELPHESLSTMLADYGDGPASALMHAAFHPNPIRRIDLELPPSAAALRRSIEAQARAEVVAGAARGHAAAAGGLRSNDLLGSSGSAVDLLESLLQHGRGVPAAASGSAAAAGGQGSGYGVGRSASVPAAGAEGGCPPGWLGSVPLGGAANLRGSMLAAESTFIFPAGLQAPAAGGAGADEAELGPSSSTAAEGGGDLGGDSTGVAPWDAWQKQQQVPPSRHITSAPGYLSSMAGMPLQPTLSRRGRDGLLTPGGSDLMAVVNRNADKLRVLQNMPDTGSTEALDQFLATFVAQSNQPKQATASGSATPVSRLMTPQVRTRPHRYSNTAADALIAGPGAAAAVGVAARCSFKALPGAAAAADTLDIELSKLDIQKAAALGHEAAAAAAAGSLAAAGRSTSSHSQAAATQAQQRLLLAGTAAGIGAAAAAAYGGSRQDGFDWAE